MDLFTTELCYAAVSRALPAINISFCMMSHSSDKSTTVFLFFHTKQTKPCFWFRRLLQNLLIVFPTCKPPSFSQYLAQNCCLWTLLLVFFSPMVKACSVHCFTLRNIYFLQSDSIWAFISQIEESEEEWGVPHCLTLRGQHQSIVVAAR